MLNSSSATTVINLEFGMSLILRGPNSATKLPYQLSKLITYDHTGKSINSFTITPEILARLLTKFYRQLNK